EVPLALLLFSRSLAEGVSLPPLASLDPVAPLVVPEPVVPDAEPLLCEGDGLALAPGLGVSVPNAPRLLLGGGWVADEDELLPELPPGEVVLPGVLPCPLMLPLPGLVPVALLELLLDRLASPASSSAQPAPSA